MTIPIDLTGQYFGSWEVLERIENNKHGKCVFNCRCTKCDKVYPVVGHNLLTGASTLCKSCSQTGKTLTEEDKEKIRKFATGRHPTEDTRLKLSIAKRGEKSPRYGKPITHSKGSWYDSVRNGPIWMRSTYESRFCQRADDLCYSYDWEPEAFPLEVEGKATTYRPDVFVRDLNLWIEIKGYWRTLAIAKFAAFLVRYPEERIVVMTIDELNRFEQGESLEHIYKEEF